ncbi:histidine kinase [Pusillimonas sp. TS35]|nr:histidine kinase [Pusillimonas sp. TS35]
MYRAILAVSLLSMGAMVVTVLLVNEDLEETMMRIEYSEERDFILQNRPPDEMLVWDTQDIAIVYIPKGHDRPAAMPAVLRGLPAKDFSKELVFEGRTYIVNVQVMGAGILYMAKNITHFEDRETLFQIALVIMTLVIVALSLLLALLGARRIVMPLRLLAQHISRVPVGANMPRINEDYAEAELHTIATTFNRFLDELESYVKREQSLLGLASHELRTPIAVMSGALDIIEARGQLNANDRTTLARMRRACDEMRANVDVLLKLARRDGGTTTLQHIDMGEVARQVIDDLAVSHAAGERVMLAVRGTAVAQADPTLVTMLLRNLIQNALQHTQQSVHVVLAPGLIEVGDEGGGLGAEQQAILRGEKRLSSDGTALSGLGLYIVTLTCERLGWRLEVGRGAEGGTLIRVYTLCAAQAAV